MNSADNGQNTPVAPRKNRLAKANNNQSMAAKYNAKIAQSIVETLEKDPEADLVAVMGKDYTKKRAMAGRWHDTRVLLEPTATATILSPLSYDLQLLLPGAGNLMYTVNQIFAHAEVVSQNPWGYSTMVLRVSDKIVAKISRRSDGTDEYAALQYLDAHLPHFPAPKPHGLIELEHFYLNFMTYIPGLDLEKAWPRLDLDAWFSEMRSLRCPENSLLGGIQGKRYKDGRRGLRVASTPIINVKEFEGFVFSGPRYVTPIYVEFLRELCPPSPKKSRLYTWRLTGIIDWERVGFYPEYWESIKVTNNLAINERCDWYKHLPECLHPKFHAQRWLLDLVWDPMVASLQTSL
ncbi:hypothetical protein F4779DRAFT_625968 [Xylariaceae sp. FL0662B]|nr:hypothetical protein F4779DRAFT_625968 [Xylariaceae sp. FL0662B]